MRLPAKIFLFALLLVPFYSLAQTCIPGNGVTCTGNLGLWVPPLNYQNWQIPLNNNWQILDSAVSSGGFLPNNPLHVLNGGTGANNGPSALLNLGGVSSVLTTTQNLASALSWTGGPGGTPAATTIANLGGVSSLLTSLQTMAGPLSWIGGASGTPASTTLSNLGGVSSVLTIPQIMHGPLTVPGITPTGFGIADWKDNTYGCHAYRGVVNVLDCGAVADGSYEITGCGNTAPNGCFAGTDNTAAIREAVAALPLENMVNGAGVGSGGGVVYFPSSGTNIWMVGANSLGQDECALDSVTGTYGIFNLPNGVVLQGQGRWITAIMANPGTAISRTCAMIQNSQSPPLYAGFKGLRIDGNEGTDSGHNEWLHPNNNHGTSTNRLMGINFTGTQRNGPGVILDDFVISGFSGSGSDGPFPGATSYVSNQIYVEASDGYILFNQYGTVVLANADSVWHNIYWQSNGGWTGVDGLDIYYGGASYTSNYFGGGSYGTCQVGIYGAKGNKITNSVFDNTGGAQLCLLDASNSSPYANYNFISNSSFSQPGNAANVSTSTTSVTIGTGTQTFTTQPSIGYYPTQPFLAVDSASTGNYETGTVTSYSGTTLVANITAVAGSGTIATWNLSSAAPFILVGGHSSENLFSNNYCNTGPLGHSTFCVQETGSATGNNYTGFNVSVASPPGIAGFSISSGSEACATIGANNAYCGGANPIYRCTTAGTLPVGALTTVTGNCGASVPTNQWSQ